MTQTIRQLELTPLTAHEVLRKDHEDLLAALHTVRDVVHDVLAGDEVPLVDTQPQPQAVLQLRHEVLTDPGQLCRGVGHEDVVVKVPFLQMTSSDVTPSSEGLVQHEAEVPAVTEEGHEGQTQDEDDHSGHNELAGVTGQQARLVHHVEGSHRSPAKVAAVVV